MESLLVSACFSGHGFKLSPIIGQWMAQLILAGNKPDDMQHIAFDQFARGVEIRPRYGSGVLE
jgi:glycine/D-amino acid oxidase-like deaminating enzyme